MAKKIVDEEIRYSIIINGDDAKKELYTLEAATRKLNQTNKELRAEKTRLASANQKNSAEYKAVTAALKANNAELKANEHRMAELRKDIGLTGLTMAQLESESKKLRLALRNLTPGSAEFVALQAQLTGVNNRLREVRGGAQATAFSMGRLADQFNRYQTLAFTFIGVITGIGLSLQKLIGYNKDLEDQLSNVRKTTGLTDAQVRELSNSLGKIDTRTARMQLLKLAEEAGRLGKESTEDIEGFVRVADKLFVALGDDFGENAEESIRNIGKLTDLFEIGAKNGVDFEQAMEMLGSSINEVSASGATQAGYLVDFLNRTAGIGRQAKISAQDFIGFAATLDEGAQSVEVSGTVMSNLISKMFKDSAAFAKAANIPIAEFSQLLGTDTNEALLRFFEGINRNQGGLGELVENMDGLGIDGQRATSVLGLLASSVDKVRQKQDLANKSLLEATSLQAEFDVKNQNAAGNIEKIGKRIASAISFKGLNEAIIDGSRWLAVFVGAIEDASSSANRWREILSFTAKAVAVYVTGLVTYKTATILATSWTNRHALATKLLTIAETANATTKKIILSLQAAYITATSALTGRITLLTAAQRLLNIVMAANPFILIATLAASAAAAIYLYSGSVKELTAVQKNLADVRNTAEKEILKEKLAVTDLLKVAKDETLSKEKRAAAIGKLNSISPEYLGKLNLENIAYLDAAIAVHKYIDSLRQAAEQKAIQQKREELAAQKLDKELEGPQINIGDRVNAFPFNSGEDLATSRFKREIAAIDDQLTALADREKKIILQKKSVETFPYGYKNPTSPQSLEVSSLGAESPDEASERQKREKEAAADADRQAKEALARFKALQQKIADLEHEAELDRMQANDREIAEIQDKYAQLRQEAVGHKAELARLDALEGEELRLKQLEQLAKSEELRIQKEEEIQKAIAATREKYGLLSDREKLDAEIAELKESLDKKLLTQEEFEIALQALKDKYARNILGQTKEQQYADDLSKLQVALDDELITYEQFLQAKAEIDSKYSKGLEKDLNKPWKDWTPEAKIGAVADSFGQLSGAVNNLMQIELAKTEVVRNAGETEETFTKRQETENEKRKEIEKKYAKIRMLTTIGEIVGQTALAVMKVFPIVPLQVIAAALGATQVGIAVAENQKIQGYETGLYPELAKKSAKHKVTDQLGRNYTAPVVNNVGTGKITDPTILVGEKPEIVVDPKTTRVLEMNYPEVLSTIYQVAGKVRGYQTGHYPATTVPTPVAMPAPAVATAPVASTQTADNAALMAYLAQQTAIMQKIEESLNGGIQAVYDDGQVRKIRERLEVNNQVKAARKP